MKKSSILASIVLSMTLVACASTQNSRGTGQVFDDATVTAKVKTEIAQAQGASNAAGINVDTYRGVVSLAGFVDNEQQARAAVQAARRVDGVTEVKNNLTVKPAAK